MPLFNVIWWCSNVAALSSKLEHINSPHSTRQILLFVVVIICKTTAFLWGVTHGEFFFNQKKIFHWWIYILGNFAKVIDGVDKGIIIIHFIIRGSSEDDRLRLNHQPQLLKLFLRLHFSYCLFFPLGFLPFLIISFPISLISSYPPLHLYNGIFHEIFIGQKHLVGPEILQFIRSTWQT